MYASGAEKLLSAQQALDQLSGFWPALNNTFDNLGFSESNILNVDRAPRSKVIKDGLWGMMEFTTSELLLIDSPLLQRLRGIKQLGLSALTYPTAEHTRFVHSLGVAHIVKRLIRAIDETAEKNGSLQVNGHSCRLVSLRNEPRLRESLIHAALLHDIGHLPFSHATETAITHQASNVLVGGVPLKKITRIFRELEIDSDLSELLSIIICLSPRFSTFYSNVTGDANPKQRIAEIASFIAGIPHQPGYQGLANLISGSVIDADKIDYINRDAKQCGIPVGVDVSRIFLNTALVELHSDQVEDILKSAGGAQNNDRFQAGIHFCVNSSGIDSYEEIINSRSILFQRVYLHQFTRNMEQLLSESIRRSLRVRNSDHLDVLNLFTTSDDLLLHSLEGQAESELFARRIRLRDAPKRVLILNRDVFEPFLRKSDISDSAIDERAAKQAEVAIEDAQIARQTGWKVWDRLYGADAREAPERVTRFREAVRERAVKFRQVLDSSFDPEALARSEPYVAYSPRYAIKPTQEVLVRHKNAIGFSDKWTTSEELSHAEQIAKATDYIFADSDWVRFVRLACIDHIAEEYGGNGTTDEPRKLNFSFRLEEMCSRVSCSYREVLNDFYKLSEGGLIDGRQFIIPLFPEQREQCQALVKKFRNYHGTDGWTITEQLVCAFVQQFPVMLRDETLRMLAQIQVLDRIKLSDGIDVAIGKEKLAENERYVFCQFSPSSGSEVRTLHEADNQQRLSSEGHLFARSLAEIPLRIKELKDKGRLAVVCFVDDSFATGGQARCQILHWSGRVVSDWPPELQGEKNIEFSDFTGMFEGIVKEHRIVLAFVYGNKSGTELILKEAEGIGWDNLTVTYANEMSVSQADVSEQLRAFLTVTGTQLLMHFRGVSSDADEGFQGARDDSLGYGGQASLIMTTRNAPSHAVTALWCPGIAHGRPWVPLFLRRGYSASLSLV